MNGMMVGGMFSMNHDFKIFYYIMKRIFVFMVNVFILCKFSAKMLLHYITMFINPFSFGVNLNLPIFNIADPMDSSAKKGFCSRVGHAFLRSAFYLVNSGTFSASTGIPEGFSVVPPNGRYRVSTNLTGLFHRFFHVYIINQLIHKGNRFMEGVRYVSCP